MATVTSKGQITIPKEIRDALGLLTGTQVEFELQDGRVILRKRVPREALAKWRGSLRGKVPFDRTDDLMEELRGEIDDLTREIFREVQQQRQQQMSRGDQHDPMHSSKPTNSLPATVATTKRTFLG